MKEGVIQYQLDFMQQPLPDDIPLAELTVCRQRLWLRGLIGQDPKRYQGLGYGNVSQRFPDKNHAAAFIITGSQTGHLPQLQAKDYAWVLNCQPQQNYLQAMGLIPPSSEAMTHAVVYQALPWVQGVIHVHWPKLWQNSRALGLPATASSIGYGTPEMAEAIKQLVHNTDKFSSGIVAMLGHEDGIVTWGATLEAAEQQLMQYTEY